MVVQDTRYRSAGWVSGGTPSYTLTISQCTTLVKQKQSKQSKDIRKGIQLMTKVERLERRVAMNELYIDQIITVIGFHLPSVQVQINELDATFNKLLDRYKQEDKNAATNSNN